MLDSLPPELREHAGVPGPDRTGPDRTGLDRNGAPRVTLLQLSTTFCAPCRHTRILLTNLASRTEGLRHVEVDLTHHPEWSTPLGVHETPTTLVLDATGQELFRVSGVPRRGALAEALRPHLGGTSEISPGERPSR